MKKKFKFRFLTFVMAMVLAIGGIGGTIPAMAAEVDDTTNNVVESMDYTEEAEMLRAKIDEMIGETNKTRDTYKTDYWGYTKIKGAAWGGSYHTIYGHQARLCIAFRPTDGDYSDKFKVRIQTEELLSHRQDKFDYTMEYNPSTIDADGYHMFVGDWEYIDYKTAYKLHYALKDGSLREIQYHVWVDYK